MYEWQKRKLWMWIDLIMSQSIYQNRTSVRVTYSFPALNAFMLSITWHLGCLCLFLLPPSRFSLNVESAAPSLNYVQPSYPNYNANVNFKKTSAPQWRVLTYLLCVFIWGRKCHLMSYIILWAHIFVCLYEDSSSRPVIASTWRGLFVLNASIVGAGGGLLVTPRWQYHKSEFLEATDCGFLS